MCSAGSVIHLFIYACGLALMVFGAKSQGRFNDRLRVEHGLQDAIEVRRAHPALDEERSTGAIALHDQWNGPEGLRQGPPVVPATGAEVDEDGSRRGQGGRVGEGLVGEEQPLVRPDLKGLQT